MNSPWEWQTQLDDVPVPRWVADLAGGDPVRPIWRNEDGGITYRFGSGSAYLKVQVPGIDWQPDAERARLNWLAGRLPVPRVLRHGHRGAAHWLLTAGLPGRSAVDLPWRGRPEVAVPQLGRALRRFHDDLPIDECPFDWSVATRVAHYDLHPGFLAHTPPSDLVVCHGDACNPNFLLADDGGFTGYVDLGGSGVADRWADLAPALQSLGWNYGPGWEPSFLRAYGAEPDQPKRLFYSALWDGVGEELGRFPTPSAATADPGASPG